MSNYTVQNLIQVTGGSGRIPAIKVGDIVFLIGNAIVVNTVLPSALFVSNDTAYKGSYAATSESFNNAPVYELTQ